MLRIHCTVFRILNLPLELRDMIYGMAFERTPDTKHCNCQCGDGQHNFNPSKVSVLRTDDHYVRRRIGNPALLQVNRQVRSEAGKVYYRSKQFHMQVEVHMLADPEKEVGKWLRTVVGEFATHLREFIIHLDCSPDSAGEIDFAQIRVQYRPGHGLQATGSIDKWEDEQDGFKRYHLPLVGMPAYIAALERIRVKYKEQGEIIVEFF